LKCVGNEDHTAIESIVEQVKTELESDLHVNKFLEQLNWLKTLKDKYHSCGLKKEESITKEFKDNFVHKLHTGISKEFQSLEVGKDNTEQKSKNKIIEILIKWNREYSSFYDEQNTDCREQWGHLNDTAK
jgi:hypothetical protein